MSPYVARHRRTVVASKIQDKANAAGLIRMNNMVTEEDGIENFRLKQLQTPDEIGPSINHTLTPASVTGQLGSTVYLHCVVHNRAQKTVTWLRRSDYHILTVGSLTYTSDERFSSSARTLQGKDTFTFPLAANRGSDSIVAATTTEHSAWHSPDRGTSSPDRTEDWMLQIRGVTIADAGEYECQINTQHPLISTHINLIVLAPHAQIVEAPELYVNSGSTIALTCVIHDCPQPLTHIFWYHQDKVINYERHVNVSMERPGSIPEEVRTSKLASDMVRGLVLGDRHKWIWTQISRLLIHMASTEHSGRYTCAPVDSSPASVHVHVLQAEEHLGSRRSHDASSASSTGNSRIIEGGSILDRPRLTLSFLKGLPLLAFELLFLFVVAKTT
ncbi:uncharacterized protein LOC111259518 isoform X2 [Varroa jacobsoni]|uniref:uncharacterized protein LOC111259518 isoform X2 n=1 Tax=Varroa jacobsoni TaxID=62625 RepID=UPI000BF59692|nr:uncharacterized protein LOC111259518 isoform X2 [Varroa jacobsoni]